MKLGRWAGLIAGSLLAVSAIAMTGNAAYADDKVPSLDVNGADTIVPGTAYDVQFVFTNDKARDLSKAVFGFGLANYDGDKQDTGTTAFKPSEVKVEYKAGSNWQTVKMDPDEGDGKDAADPGLLWNDERIDAPSATDKTTATYEFRITLHAPSTLQTLTVGGFLVSTGSPEKALVKRAITPKTAITGKTAAPEIWAIGGMVVTVQQPSASPTPSTPANAGGGGSLPTTGASTGVLVAGGLLLLVAGAGFTVATRRRRTANGRHAG